MRHLAAISARTFSNHRPALARLPRLPTAPPAGPSCSRWLSCTCCRRSDARPTSPSPNIPSLGALQTMTMPHLPLPPPLPWSPDSQPFIRHLQILSLALLSPSADESWDIYEALHPDLRPAIPDDIFASLLAHQLSASSSKKRASRLLEMVDLARSCDMRPEVLGASTLEDALLILLRRNQARGDPESRSKVDWMWTALRRLQCGELGRINNEVRRLMLSFLADGYETKETEIASRAQQALQDLIDHGGDRGLGPVPGKLVGMYKGSDPVVHQASLRLGALCLARDIDVPDRTLQSILARLCSSYAKQGESAAAAKADVDALVDELREGHAREAANRLAGLGDAMARSHRTPAEKAAEVTHDLAATMPQAHRAGERLAKAAQDDASFETLVNLCLRALQMPEADYEALLRITTRRLRTTPHDPVLALRLTQGVLNAGILGTHQISPQLTTHLMNLIIDTPLPESYGMAVKFYHAARAYPAPTEHRWQFADIPRWSRLFFQSLKHKHLHFASRLYTDFIADGLTVPTSHALAFIGKAASTPSASRMILLERHIKDFIWDDQASTQQLALVLTRGLASTGPDASAIAIKLVRRLQPTLSVPVISAVMTPLITSSKAGHRELAVSLLRELPATAEATPSYNAVLAGLAKNIRNTSLEHVLAVYHDMLKRGIPSTVETASNITKALLKSDSLKTALAVFDAAVKSGQALQSSAVGSLMIRLALDGRTTEAYAVETQWRALFPSAPAYDSAVFGARLVVDIKAGKDVDLQAFEQTSLGKEDYKPTRPFLRFLQELQSKGQPHKAVKDEPNTCDDDTPATETASSGKAPLQPVTPSSSGASGSGTWLMDRPGPSQVWMA